MDNFLLMNKSRTMIGRGQPFSVASLPTKMRQEFMVL